MKLVCTAALVLSLLSEAVAAHDSWLEPASFQVPLGAPVPVIFYVGHHGEQHKVNLSSRPKWLQRMQVIGQGGAIDLLRQQQFNPTSGVPTAGAGTYLLSLDTADFRQDAAPDVFEVYLEQEGLASAQEKWKRSPIQGRKVRESYRRHAKSLVQVCSGSPALDGPATQRLGQRLEIVPAVNPYRLRGGDRLGANIWFRDKPLVNAQVTLSSLDQAKEDALTDRSDSKGGVQFTLPSTGRWMMNVVWSEPSTAKGIDYQTSFASLTFAVPPNGGC